MTLDKYLAEVEERLKAATPGKWECSRDLMTFKISVRSGPSICKLEDDDYGTHDDKEFFKRWNDSELIANAPTDLTKLIRVVRILRDKLEEIKIEHCVRNEFGKAQEISKALGDADKEIL